MSKFNYFWIILAALSLLVTSKANAQSFGAPIDILGPVQEDLIREIRQRPRQRTQPSSPQPIYTDTTADKLFDRGLQLLQQDNYQSSLAVYDKVLSLNPRWASAYVNRGLARSGLKDYQGGLEDVNYAIRLEPTLAGAYVARSYILYKIRDYQAAFEAVNQSMKREPSAIGYLVRGGILSAMGNYQAAFEDATRAIRLNPKLDGAYNLRGRILMVLGEENRALEDVNRAVDLGKLGVSTKRLAAFYGSLSIVHYELGNKEKTITDLRTATNLYPENDESMLALAIVLFATGDRQESLRLAEKAIRIDRNLADLAYLKEVGWGKRLLADTQTFFNAPQTKGMLSATNTSSSKDQPSQAIHPEASKKCDMAIENLNNAIDAIDTRALVSSQQLLKVQQANQLRAEQCKNL
jgi:tetratricopeptide (TPR) repeat protein